MGEAVKGGGSLLRVGELLPGWGRLTQVVGEAVKGGGSSEGWGGKLLRGKLLRGGELGC